MREWEVVAPPCTDDIDGVTAAEYAQKLEANLLELLERFKSGRYQAPPVRRINIPKRERVRHHRIGDQVSEINAVLRGHYAYYGVAGNIRALFKVYRAVERYWHRMLRSRSWAASRLTWDTFNQIKQRTPLLRPKLRLPYRELQALAVL